MMCVMMGAKMSVHSFKSFVGMVSFGDVLSRRLLMMFLVVSMVIGTSAKFVDRGLFVLAASSCFI